MDEARPSSHVFCWQNYCQSIAQDIFTKKGTPSLFCLYNYDLRAARRECATDRSCKLFNQLLHLNMWSRIFSWIDDLWIAPELLRKGDNRPVYGTQAGDVYSFGIIVSEIVTRDLPFAKNELHYNVPGTYSEIKG